LLGFNWGSLHVHFAADDLANIGPYFEVVWVRDQCHLRQDVGKDPMTSLGAESWDIFQQRRANDFRPRSGASVAFFAGPFSQPEHSRNWTIEDRKLRRLR
jgi:hypothetical protein